MGLGREICRFSAVVRNVSIMPQNLLCYKCWIRQLLGRIYRFLLSVRYVYQTGMTSFKMFALRIFLNTLVRLCNELFAKLLAEVEMHQMQYVYYKDKLLA